MKAIKPAVRTVSGGLLTKASLRWLSSPLTAQASQLTKAGGGDESRKRVSGRRRLVGCWKGAAKAQCLRREEWDASDYSRATGRAAGSYGHGGFQAAGRGVTKMRRSAEAGRCRQRGGGCGQSGGSKAERFVREAVARGQTAQPGPKGDAATVPIDRFSAARAAGRAARRGLRAPLLGRRRDGSGRLSTFLPHRRHRPRLGAAH